MKPNLPRALTFLLICVTFPFCGTNASAQGDDNMATRFSATLKNATLKGSWAPVQEGRLGNERNDDGYRIARVEHKEGDEWSVVSIFKINDQQLEFPIPAKVRFAGDTAVLILDNIRAGRGKANWSARVMFHEDVYAGRWWETGNKEHGGTIAGTVTRDNE
ncbi:hypothetical protein [Gimesia maris]|uniref:hypothetical protein n=1 Tax=Gimesia maris TaxID=122 RepID=UPI003A9395CF